MVRLALAGLRDSLVRLALAGLLLLIPAIADAQTPAWLFPDRNLLPSLLAPPREPVVKGMLVYADPGPTEYGSGMAGEVALSGSIPVLRLGGSDSSNALVLGLEGAVFAHFSLDVVTRELVNTDWLFTVPLVWHRGRHWLRLRYYHTSSHLGDEYQRRFGPSSINFARDGADLIVNVRPGLAVAEALGLRVYAGALWSPNSHPEEGTVWRARGGLELDPSDGAIWRPYLALDVEIEEESAHGARWTAQGGIWGPPIGGRPSRLALEASTGPSALGQFYRRKTGTLALALFWNP